MIVEDRSDANKAGFIVLEKFYLGEFKRYILGEYNTISSRFKQRLN